MRYDRDRNPMSRTLLSRPFILYRPIPAPVDVRVLCEVIERLRRPVEARRDVMPTVILRQSIGPTGAALKTPRSRLRCCENQCPRHPSSSPMLIYFIVIAIARDVPPRALRLGANISCRSHLAGCGTPPKFRLSAPCGCGCPTPGCPATSSASRSTTSTKDTGRVTRLRIPTALRTTPAKALIRTTRTETLRTSAFGTRPVAGLSSSSRRLPSTRKGKLAIGWIMPRVELDLNGTALIKAHMSPRPQPNCKARRCSVAVCMRIPPRLLPGNI